MLLHPILALIVHRYDKSKHAKEMDSLNAQLAETKNDNAILLSENEALKAEADERKNNPLRWTGLIYSDSNNHPVCPVCHDDRGKRIHLPDDTVVDGYWRCRICGEKFSFVNK